MLRKLNQTQGDMQEKVLFSQKPHLELGDIDTSIISLQPSGVCSPETGASTSKWMAQNPETGP